MTTVVVVDDSPFMRAQIADVLESEGLEVLARVNDGRHAVEAVETHEPDVVTMDIKMPGIDGLEAVQRVMDARPTPILMLSGYVEEGTNLLFESLDAGAVDFFPKPGGEVSPSLARYGELLADTVRAVAAVDVGDAGGRTDPPGDTVPAPTTATTDRASTADPERPPTLVVAASTGGPSVVEELVARLPTSPAFRVLVVLHMPPKFTDRFARRLDDASEYDVTEAGTRTTVGPGEAVLAKGDHHLEVCSDVDDRLDLALSDASPRHNVRPAADVTMETAADVVRGPLAGVVLTGMGQDGAAGVAAIDEAGGYTVVQDRDACAIDGMPASAIETGAVAAELPLDRIPDAVAAAVTDDGR